MDIREKLDRLAELQASLEVIRMNKQATIDAVITPEIKARLDKIEAEYTQTSEAIQAGIESLTNEIKDEVITAGASVKGTHLHAIYAKGRVSWDSKILEGLMMVFPKLEEARKVGDP